MAMQIKMYFLLGPSRFLNVVLTQSEMCDKLKALLPFSFLGGFHLKDLIRQNKKAAPKAVPHKEVENTQTYPPVLNK